MEEREGGDRASMRVLACDSALVWSRLQPPADTGSLVVRMGVFLLLSGLKNDVMTFHQYVRILAALYTKKRKNEKKLHHDERSSRPNLNDAAACCPAGRQTEYLRRTST